MTMDPSAFLAPDVVLDWDDPIVRDRARAIKDDSTDEGDFVRRSFEWVRDRIPHSWDHKLNPVTCSASEVLKYKTGFCFAKAHLLVALLRAQGVPSGLCYQRSSVAREGKRFYLHGLCAVHLSNIGWYRMDPRGPKPGVDAQFTPPVERLAYRMDRTMGERDCRGVYARPLPVVVEALRRYRTWDEFAQNLPDLGEKERLEVPPEADWMGPSAGLSSRT
jgi:transglutaminase-like putative cysteine protease